ncbi:MAG: MFS transporter [Myxococcota bacterium]
MIVRFCAYGFLKNQRYFEPFLVLALLDWGATFVSVGALLGLRQVVRNLFEIPSGALADLWGRRRAMVLAFVAYLMGLLGFAVVPHIGGWAVGMALFGVGDAFRSGTHKAMIFEWLEQQGRAGENTKVYGYTRSWSKLGSASSIGVAVAIVLAGGSYALTFWATALPWALNALNLATYPASLEGQARSRDSMRVGAVFRHLWTAGRQTIGNARLRHLLFQAMTFEGINKATKDFVQPAAVAVAAGLSIAASDRVETTVVVGAAYFIMHLVSATASRQAHRVVAAFGRPEAALRATWLALTACLAIASGAGWASGAVVVLAVVGFAAVAVLSDIFRPVLVSCIDAETDRSHKATVLSLESQASSAAAAILAPAAGWAADLAASSPGAPDGVWAVAAMGLAVAIVAQGYIYLGGSGAQRPQA